MTSLDAADTDDGQSWQQVRSVLARLLAGLESGEVIELAAGSFYLEVGQVPGAIWLLASGPPTTELKGEAQLVVRGRPAGRARHLGAGGRTGRQRAAAGRGRVVAE